MNKSVRSTLVILWSNSTHKGMPWHFDWLHHKSLSIKNRYYEIDMVDIVGN